MPFGATVLQKNSSHFHPVKCSYSKLNFLARLPITVKTEISGTQPAWPLIWTHQKLYKGFRGNPASPVNRAHVKRLLHKQRQLFNKTAESELLICCVQFAIFCLYYIIGRRREEIRSPLVICGNTSRYGIIETGVENLNWRWPHASLKCHMLPI